VYPLLMQDDALPAQGKVVTPEVDAMTAALGRILHWPDLHASERQRRLLTYLVEETRAGRGARLKAYNIATAVLGRNERFDPQIDPVVRIEVSYLRRCLERYYLTDGRSEPLRLIIPKGSYAPHLEPATPARQTAHESLGATRTRVRRRGVYLAAGAGASLLLASLFFVLCWPDFGERRTPSDVAFAPSIRVDEFVNTSGDRGLDSFVRALTSEVASALVPFKSLDIYLPNAGTMSVPDHVDYQLRGSVSRLHNDVQVTTQLVDAKTSAILWAQDYSRPADQPAGGIEIARGIAESLGNPYGALFSLEARAAAAVTQNSPTVRACMLAFYAYMETWARELHGRLRDCHEAVVRLAPNYSEAWAHLAFLYLDEYKYGYNPVAGAAPPLVRAAAAARRAIAADPTDARAHVMLALTHWFDHDLAAFSAEAERALVLNPEDPLVAGEIGTRLFLRGDYDRGLALIRHVLSQGGGRPNRYRDITFLNAYLHRDYTAALDEAIKGDIERRPLARILVVAAYGRLGRRQDAAQTWEVLRRDIPQATKAPRAIMLDREWAPEIADAVMQGLDAAGVLDESKKDGLEQGPPTEVNQVAVPSTSRRIR
jgi:adenylate cyclase